MRRNMNKHTRFPTSEIISNSKNFFISNSIWKKLKTVTISSLRFVVNSLFVSKQVSKKRSSHKSRPSAARCHQQYNNQKKSAKIRCDDIVFIFDKRTGSKTFKGMLKMEIHIAIYGKIILNRNPKKIPQLQTIWFPLALLQLSPHRQRYMTADVQRSMNAYQNKCRTVNCQFAASMLCANQMGSAETIWTRTKVENKIKIKGQREREWRNK